MDAGGPALGGSGVVHHADAHPLQLDEQPLGQRAPERHVVVAEHRVHRRERCQLSEQAGFDDVAAVQHDVGVAQGGVHGIGESARPVVTEMGVGEDDRAHAASTASPG